METIKNFLVGAMVILKFLAVGSAAAITGYYLFIFVGKATYLVLEGRTLQGNYFSHCSLTSLSTFNPLCLAYGLSFLLIILSLLAAVFIVGLVITKVGASQRNKEGD